MQIIHFYFFMHFWEHFVIANQTNNKSSLQCQGGVPTQKTANGQHMQQQKQPHNTGAMDKLRSEYTVQQIIK
jgi:hypothetical protein